MSQLPQERLTIAIGAQSSAQKAFDETIVFTKDRKAFAGVVFDFQNTRFVLADLKARLQVGWAHLDWAIKRHLRSEEHTSELQSLMRISYAVFCLKKKKMKLQQRE